MASTPCFTAPAWIPCKDGSACKHDFKGSLLSTSLRDTVDERIAFECKDLYLNITDEFKLKKVNGRIEGNDGDLQFDSLDFTFNSCKALLNGSLENYLTLFVENEKDLLAKIDLSTELYDFPLFFSYDSSIANAFSISDPGF